MAEPVQAVEVLAAWLLDDSRSERAEGLPYGASDLDVARAHAQDALTALTAAGVPPTPVGQVVVEDDEGTRSTWALNVVWPDGYMAERHANGWNEPAELRPVPPPTAEEEQGRTLVAETPIPATPWRHRDEHVVDGRIEEVE